MTDCPYVSPRYVDDENCRYFKADRDGVLKHPPLEDRGVTQQMVDKAIRLMMRLERDTGQAGRTFRKAMERIQH